MSPTLLVVALLRSAASSSTSARRMVSGVSRRSLAPLAGLAIFSSAQQAAAFANAVPEAQQFYFGPRPTKRHAMCVSRGFETALSRSPVYIRVGNDRECV